MSKKSNPYVPPIPPVPPKPESSDVPNPNPNPSPSPNPRNPHVKSSLHPHPRFHYLSKDRDRERDRERERERERKKERVIMCNNCKKLGHISSRCKKMITSYGIVLVHVRFDGPPLYLMIRRKHTYGYISVIQNKYSMDNLPDLFQEMTIHERSMLMRYSYNELWQQMWNTTKPCGDYVAIQRFQSIRDQLPLWIEQANALSSWTEPEWDFPKGRLEYQEKEMDCALREFEEETGFTRSNILLLKNMAPLEEMFVGSNGGTYRSVYYIALLQPHVINDCTHFQTNEVGCLQWKSYEEAMSSIRSYQTAKQHLLQYIGQFIQCSFFLLPQPLPPPQPQLQLQPLPPPQLQLQLQPSTYLVKRIGSSICLFG